MIEPLRQEHVEKLRGEFDGAEFIQHENIDAMLANKACECHAITSKGEILCICGIVYLHPGLGQVWAAVSSRAMDKAATVIRGLRRLIADAFQRKPLNRIEWFTGETEKLCRWSELLGGKAEAILSRRGLTGRDEVLWMILRS